MSVEETGNVALLELMPRDVRALVEAILVRVEYGFGETIVREGDEADALYVITSGRVRAVKIGDHGREVPLGALEAGDAFGEVALLEGGRRTATIRASGPVEALRLDAAVFKGLVQANPAVAAWAERQARVYELHDFIRLRSTFAGLSQTAIGALVDALEPVDASAGTSVIEEGQPPGAMYVVRSGRLCATRAGDDGEDVTVGLLRAGDVFGERSLLTGEPRAATVRALVDSRLCMLAPEALARLTDGHPELRSELEERAARYEFRRIAHVPLDFAQDMLPAAAEAQAAVAEDARAELLEVDRALTERVADDVFRRPERTIRRFPHVWGVDEAGCGDACLAMVCRHFGKAVPLSYIHDVASTAYEGTSLHGLVTGAEALGLAARPVKASKSRLDTLPLPAICHWEGNHWVVLFATGRSTVRVSDPSRGRLKLARAEFEEKWTGYCCLVARTPALDDAPDPRPPWRWLAPFFRPHRATLVQAALLAFVVAALQMLVPVVAGLIVDRAIADGDRALLHLYALGMVGVLLAAVLATLLQRWLLARLTVRFDVETLDHITARLLSLPLSYMATRRTGDLERRLGGMRQIRLFVVQQGVVALSAAAQLLVAIVLMLVYSVPLAGVYLAAVPAYLLAMRWSQTRLRPLLSSLEEAFGRYQGSQIDAIKGFETVKATGADEALRAQMRARFSALSDRVYRSDLAFMRYEAAIQLLTFLTLVAVLWVGGLLVLDGSLTVGELVAFNGLVLLASGPLALVLRMWDELQLVSVLLTRIDDVLVREPEQGADRSALRAVPTLGGQVQIQGLTLRTGGPHPVAILDGIDLAVPAGTTVALVGRSGAGKTTLVNCLSGLLLPTEGRILYDGIDLATLDFRDLRRRIGFVPQGTYLFDDTIAANIALGDVDIDAGQVRWAARVADAADFIERLPLGYQTPIGEGGIRLSGGQAQRIAIARAAYRRPPVLILDEATSALDADSERAVKERLDDLLEGRTAFIIAHRLSTIRNADRIVVLERGRVAEQGTHTELVERRGLYWYLISQQLES